MKKIVFLILMAFTVNSVFALNQNVCSNAATPSAPNGCVKNYDCQNQTGSAKETQLSNGATITTSPATCGVGTDAGGDKVNRICGFISHGGIYADHSVTNCLDNAAGAPINTGLILLIIAGGGLGFFMFKRNSGKVSAV